MRANHFLPLSVRDRLEVGLRFDPEPARFEESVERGDLRVPPHEDRWDDLRAANVVAPRQRLRVFLEALQFPHRLDQSANLKTGITLEGVGRLTYGICSVPTRAASRTVEYVLPSPRRAIRVLPNQRDSERRPPSHRQNHHQRDRFPRLEEWKREFVLSLTLGEQRVLVLVEKLNVNFGCRGGSLGSRCFSSPMPPRRKGTPP